MISWQDSLLRGADASAAQNSSVTKTCWQCGAVLASSVRACNFCDSSFSVVPSVWEDSLNVSLRERIDLGAAGIAHPERPLSVSPQLEQDVAWRGELAQRLDAYRTRRRKFTQNSVQSQFSFDAPPGKTRPQTSLAVADPPASVEEDFPFNIPIALSPSQNSLSQPHIHITT